MPQTIKDRVLVTVISGVVSAAILGVLALALVGLSDGRVVKKMGGLTAADLSDYAQKSDLPDVSGLAKKIDIPDVTAFLKRDEIPAIDQLATKGDIPVLTGYARTSELPDARTLLTTSTALTCRAFPREDFDAEVHQCPIQTFKLAEWCSGDCGKDDARVTLCCAFER